ncbi:hypothetical protein [Aeromonas allosaccharophila]
MILLGLLALVAAFLTWHDRRQDPAVGLYRPALFSVFAPVAAVDAIDPGSDAGYFPGIGEPSFVPAQAASPARNAAVATDWPQPSGRRPGLSLHPVSGGFGS